MVDAHVSGACAARRAGSIPVLGTIPIEDSAGGVIHFTPPVFCLCRFGVAIIYYGAHLTNQGSPDKPRGLSIQPCKSEKEEPYICHSSQGRSECLYLRIE